MKKWWMYLFPSADGEEEPDIEADPDTGPDDAEEEPGEEEPNDEEEPQEPRISRAQKAVIEAKKARKEAEDRALQLQQELDSHRRSSQPSNEDLMRNQEDERLRDPELSPQERWQIEANRVLRSSKNESQQALMQAQDLSDKTSYMAKAQDNPVMKKYADRVEVEVQKMRALGQSAPRHAIYLFLLGKDLDEGKFKAKETKSGKLPDAARGKTPGAKSDVGKGGKTEHQKRAARLENQII